MTRNGPQKYPGANLSLFFGDGRYSGVGFEANCGVLHTTEGVSVVDYQGGAVAPTFTAVPRFESRTVEVYQHFDVDESARALVHKAGMPATNGAGAVQVELVGTSDPARRVSWTIGSRTYRAGVDYLFWPEAPEWALAGVGRLVRWLSDQHGVPMTSGLTFKAYPGSYGAANGVRLTQDQWARFRGWCGHQHVPQNLHGDPGAIDIDRLLRLAVAGTQAGKDANMPLTQADLDAVRAVVREEIRAAVPAPDAVAHSVLWWLNQAARGVVPQGAIDQKQAQWIDLVPLLHDALKGLSPAQVEVTVNGRALGG